VTQGFCTCKVPSPVRAEGIELCSACGERVPDPVLVVIVRQQRQIADQQKEILRRLSRLERDHDEGAPGRLLGPTQIAKRLGVSAQWAREHYAELGGTRIGEGPRPRYLFDLERAQERLADRAAREEPDQEARPEPVRRRRQASKNGPELLPVKRQST
jgi:hypothetical protein